jgi:hypothetical protein
LLDGATRKPTAFEHGLGSAERELTAAEQDQEREVLGTRARGMAQAAEKLPDGSIDHRGPRQR